MTTNDLMDRLEHTPAEIDELIAFYRKERDNLIKPKKEIAAGQAINLQNLGLATKSGEKIELKRRF